MKKAVVKGATGCIDRNLIDILKRELWDITVLHRKSSDLSRLKDRKVKFVETNFYDLETVTLNSYLYNHRLYDYAPIICYHFDDNIKQNSIFEIREA